MFGVQLAGFPSVVRGVGGMSGRHMGVVAGGFGFAGLMGVSGVAVMLGGLLVVLGGLGVVFVGVVRSHGRFLS